MKWLLFLSLSFCLAAAHPGDEPSLVPWLDSEVEAFQRARAENKPVLLYLEAVWCHWCHVIDRETYGNAEVAELINGHFIPVRIDQDARPDLANRYRDYGWPATIWFTPDGRDMVKRQGYIGPEPMARLLRAIIADPTPEASAQLEQPVIAATSSLDEALRSELLRRHVTTHDAETGGLAINQKFLDRDSVELDLVLCGEGGAAACVRARRTLDAALALIDPVWGGVYQYSTFADWEHPHFEKLATIQGEYLRIYVLAAARTGEAQYSRAARLIQDYLRNFLTDRDGAFYASQDADLVPGEKAAGYFSLPDAERRALGIPRIDRNRYARENGVIAEALATRYEFTRDETALDAALRAVAWIEANRATADGGFRHGANDPAGPYLADTLAMGRAYLALYKATAERNFLAKAGRAADFIDARFRDEHGGFSTAQSADAVIKPVPQIDENIALARFANLLFQITGESRYREIAAEAMRYLTTPDVATRRITEAGILLADREFNRDPLHLTVVGGKDEPIAQQLFLAALDQPGWYKRPEWWDRSEGPLPNPDVTYPELKRPAVFVCTDNRCSLPIFEPAGLSAFLAANQ
ncbi:MAG: DUF255 domain-containing protein [Xanthomonadales bacterium]|nr:DUF255 domain-containing protein [Xanthomonadales bacterium]